MATLTRAVPRIVHITFRGAGFSLLELLLVIAIMGIAAGIVSLSAVPSEERLLATETERLAALFRLAQNEAKVSGRPLTWEADSEGYRFISTDLRQRRGTDDPLRPRPWPFAVVSVEAPILVIGAEPLLPPAQIRIVTPSRELVLALDAFGTLTREK